MFYKSEANTAPSWIKNPHQRDYGTFYVYADTPPTFWPAPDAHWQSLPGSDDIEFLLLGEFRPQLREFFKSGDINHIKTPCGSSVPVYPAMDRHGCAWTVPVIVNERGPCLALEWALENGAVTRKASTEQKAIVETCEHIRSAFLSEAGGESLPLDMAAHAAGLILSYSYHVSAQEMLLHGVLDDHLTPRVLMAACGFGTPDHQMMAAH